MSKTPLEKELYDFAMLTHSVMHALGQVERTCWDSKEMSLDSGGLLMKINSAETGVLVLLPQMQKIRVALHEKLAGDREPVELFAAE